MGAGAVGGLAALLFLLDGFTYFPVMYVANRGFIMALFFGVLYLYEHHRWRSLKTRSALVLSALFLTLAVFAEEGGAAAFAFIVAYAIVLEPGSRLQKALTLWPSILVLTLWRAIYVFAGYGLSHIGTFYIDPLNEPLRFGRKLLPRVIEVLGGQLTSLPPEFSFILKPSLHPVVVALYGVCVVIALAAFLPSLRRDKLAAFWCVAMVLAAIPESSLVPISKNFGFVAIGAYGLIASVGAALFQRRLPGSRAWQMLAGGVCVLLLLVHVPGALAGRIMTAKVTNDFFAWANRPLRDWPYLENQNIIVLNFPVPLASGYLPGYRAYYHQPLPRSVRTLVPGCTGFTVLRADDQTLVLQSGGANIFSCEELGPLHVAYFLSTCNLLLDRPECKTGDRYDLNGLTMEVLASDPAGLPSRVAFHFDHSLDSPDFRWFSWDWRTFSTKTFKMPAVGQSALLSGPIPPPRKVTG